MSQENNDSIYLQATVSFKDKDNPVEVGTVKVLPKDQLVTLLDSARILIETTLIKKEVTSATIFLVIKEKTDKGELILMDEGNMDIEGIDKTMKSINLKCPNFTIILIAGFDEIVNVEYCTDPECLKGHR